MTKRGARLQAGFSLIELLVSLAILLLSLSALATLLIQNARTNRAQQLTLATQAAARNSLSVLVPVLRTAGWDPRNAGLPAVSLDTSGDGAWIEVFADLNEDGDVSDADEDVFIRFQGNKLEWRKTGDVSQPFVTLAEDISNDEDGNGTPEPMFVPDSLVHPTKIAVRITARSPVLDPGTGQYIRYTATTDVLLRGNL